MQDIASHLERLAPAARIVRPEQSQFTSVIPRGATSLPSQGWKLHLSAYSSNVASLLEAAVPVLLAHEVQFKVIATKSLLDQLNAGSKGVQQAGKALTAYPVTPHAAVDLARELASATQGLVGPQIRTDRPIGDHGVVWYRYGAFGGTQSAGPFAHFQILDNQGQHVPDRRDVGGAQPEWATDPFVETALTGADPFAHERPYSVVAGRWMLVQPIVFSARGSVHSGVDLETKQRCVIRLASETSGAILGAGADGLLTECIALEALHASPSVGAPRALGTHRMGDVHVSAATFLAGVTLSRWRADFVAAATYPEPVRLIELAQRLIGRYAALHALGWVHGDIKGTNVIVDADVPYLVDFEMSQRPSAGGSLDGGSIGYMSPARCRGSVTAAMVEDIYGIGALLALLITGRDPGLAVGDNMYAADPRLLNPHAPEVLITAARACLQADERQRPTAAELLELLEGPTTRATQTASKPASSAQVARLIVAELAAQRVANQTGAQWTSTALNPQGAVFHDMYAGSAGIALGVADAVDAHVPGAVELLSSTRETLTRALSTTTAQGLFTGRAGIAVALAASFGDLSTAEAELVRSAVRDTVEYPNTDWDLIAGNAGMAIAAVTVAEVTRDNSLLDVARGHAAVVVASAIGDPVRPAWEMDDQLNSGMAHGSAGALASLLTVGVAAGDDKLLEVAEAAAHRLCDDAESCGQDEQGVRWHAQARRPAWGSWCHGSAGIAMVLARAGRVLGVQRFGEVALRGAMSLVDIRAVGPCLCHGLAGSVMAVDEIGRLTEDVDLVDAAEPLRVILRSMAEAQPDPSGHGTASSPLAASMSPDLLLGFAGLLPAMLANDGKDRRVGGGGRVAALLAGRPITGQP